MFFGPKNDTSIEPIEELTNESNPPKYRKYTFGEYLEVYKNQQGKQRNVKQFFKIENN